jgi:hypothetical protein
MALAAVVVTATMAWSAGQVSGKYVGNGQEAKLTHAVVVPHEPWEGEQAYTVILSEKDPAGVKKPDFDAMFGKLGHALIVSLTRKGDIFSTQVCHQGLQKSGFSTVGSLFVDKLKIEGGQISGHFFTKQPETFFEDTWEADLTFQAKLP